MTKISVSDTRRPVKIALILALFSGLAVYQSPAVVGRVYPAISPVSVQTDGQQEFFEKKVRPILANSCQRCHNPKAKVAGLDLTTAEAFQRGGERGPVVDKEKPEESRLLKAVSYDGDLKMPPSGKLQDHEIAALTDWVKMGAPWPGAAPATASENWPKNSTVRPFTEQEKVFWAYQPVKD